MHLDSDFEHLSYGNNENDKGTRLGNLMHGDFLAFYVLNSSPLQSKTDFHQILRPLTA